jgi:hypothetical protein
MEEEKEDGDLKWTLMEIKVEKLAYGGKKRLVAGVFHQADADFVVQFEILEQDYKKLKATLYGCLGSFKFITRTGALAPAVTEGRIDLTDESELTPKEREKRREEKQAKAFKKAVDGLPDGWDSFEYKGVCVLSHTDRKFAMKVAKQVVAVREWLDKTFPCMGDEYVRKPIVRICANRDEESSYYDGSGDAWSNAGREIVTHKDQSSGSASWEFEWLNRNVVSGWFADKDPDLGWRMPDWLEGALGQYVGTGTLKGSRMQFKPDQWEKEKLRTAIKSGEWKGIQVMILMSPDEFQFQHQSQSAAFLRFLLDGPGRGLKGAKTFLEDYLNALRFLVQERIKAEEAEEPEVREGAQTEEEEDEEFRQRGERRKKWKEEEKAFLQQVFERAFEGWDERRWKSLEAAFLQWAD